MTSGFDAERAVADARAAGLLDGTDEELVRSLRSWGLSLIQSAMVVAKGRGVPLGEAKETVAGSPSWTAEFEANAPLHDAAERLAEQ